MRLTADSLVYSISVLCVTAWGASATRVEARPLQSQSAAIVRMAFDVASVRAASANGSESSRFPLGPGDAFAPGGLFSATSQPLIVYLRFAYKLSQSDLLGLPAWIYSDRFDIEARAPGNPTKDQMRLMMQSLLAERFKMRTHVEREMKPAFNLVLLKAGKTGPQLRPHSEDDSCATEALPPIPCGTVGPVPASLAGRGRLAGRRVTISRIAGILMNPFTGVDRPVFDRTGLAGTFDFNLEWSLVSELGPAPAAQSEDAGSTFLQALQEQLGLKLKSTKAPVDVLVIDHVEHPTEN